MNLFRRLTPLILFAACSSLMSCAWPKRSSSRIVEGESSNIKYSNPEAAGGPVGGR